MDKYSIEIYDLLSRALGSNDVKRLQGYLDDVMAVKYNGLQLDGFEFAEEMQIDFTYEQVQKEIGLNVMAQYVDLDSPAIPLGSEGFQLGTGKIPRMKLVDYINEDKVRKKKILEQRFGVSSDRAVNSARNTLFTTIDNLFGGHTNSLTYQRHQIVSKGKFTLTDKNNPNGIVGLTFAAHVPDENFMKLEGERRWWKKRSLDGVYSEEGSACDPIKDMKDTVRKAKNKGVQSHWEIDSVFADQVVEHSKIRQAIALRIYPLATGDTLAAAVASVSSLDTKEKLVHLGKIVGTSFKIIDSIVSVEKWNKDKKKLERPAFRAFEDNSLVLVPNGSLGEILTVEPISFGGTAATFYGGRLLLTVDVDFVKKCQAFHTEMTSLVVPDKPQYMYYINPYGTV